MSNIMIYDIVGTGHFVVPESNNAALLADSDINDLLSVAPGVAGLVYSGVKAWVLDSKVGDGAEGPRTLACLLSGFSYNGEICPGEPETDALIAALRVALLTVPPGDVGIIISVGVIEVNIFNTGLAPVVP
jgi:hypothetical protein